MAKKKEVAKKIENIEVKKDLHEKQLKIIIGVIIGVLILLLGIVIFQQMAKSFEYRGIEFKKINQGRIEYYEAQIPAFDSSGNKVYTSSVFRIDPRKLNAELNITKIGFVITRPVYLSYAKNSEMKICEDNALAAANLAGFLRIFGLNVQGAINDESYKNSSITYANCETNPGNSVIEIKSGNETRITQINDRCFEIVFNDCDILKATETFQLAVLQDWVNRVY